MATCPASGSPVTASLPASKATASTCGAPMAENSKPTSSRESASEPRCHPDWRDCLAKRSNHEVEGAHVRLHTIGPARRSTQQPHEDAVTPPTALPTPPPTPCSCYDPRPSSAPSPCG